ncbi:histidine kinase [Microaerobacter geothermalis]|uniref:sensor histidine kinase n=1 Tax=Microaerobacter geothermalis TaxID=674972 RepID=UPI001F1E7CA6|nr:ATP-binding protein [Microaerobacter geothermalis]MCF6094913.1 histidine kinase [Microaerobacter geothermalis]
MAQFFETNQAIIHFIYPLIFFLMGFGILLKNRVHSHFYLAKSLQYLSLFGILHGIADWGNIFIPIQKSYLSDQYIFLLESFKMVIGALSFYFLFFFGVHLLHQSMGWNRKILLLPGFVFILWFANFILLQPFLVTEDNQEWWFAISDIWARYLLAFPGGVISSYALYLQKRQFEDFGVPQMTRTLHFAVMSIGFYAFTGGLIVPYAPVIPAILVNSDLFFTTTGLPVELFRGLSGLFMAFFILKILKVFDIEYQKFFYHAERSKAVMEERNRIARDLHDGMIQSIYAIGLHLEGIRHGLSRNKSVDQSVDLRKSDQKLQEVIHKLNDIILEIRGYIKELKNPVNRETKLKEEIERLIRELNVEDRLEIEFQYNYLGEDIPLSHTVQIYYIVKEALSNVLRHSEATKATISIHGTDEDLCVEVIDNGKGMEEPDSSKETEEKFLRQGLQNMKFRAKSMGGKLMIKTIKNRGTRVLLQLNRGGKEHDKSNNKINAGRRS